MGSRKAFQPEWCSAPGDTITDILEERGISLEDFAERMGHTYRQAYDLLHGRESINIETARQLENVIGASARFWMTRDAQYQQDRGKTQPQVLDIASKEWLRQIPVADMIKFKWVEPATTATDKLSACLSFFDVPDVESWREKYSELLSAAAFRTSPTFESQPGAVVAWLRQGEIRGDEIECETWSAKSFKRVLSDIRPLTRIKDPISFLPKLKKMCANCGVAVAIVRAPRGCRASGATRFLSPNKALLLLSFRYLSDDQFWFTFFHEAGHLLLHSKKALFLEDTSEVTSKEEDEANEFAKDILIPQRFQPALSQVRINAREILRLAVVVGVSRGVIVGQLQHANRIQPNKFNYLKRRYDWSQIDV